MPRYSALFKFVVYSFAAVMLAALIMMAILMLTYPTDGDKPDTAALPPSATQAAFRATTDKAGLEKAINTYIYQHMSSDGLEFRIRLDETLQFEGDIYLAGLKVRLTVAFEPEVRDNGDLILRQQHFKVGSLPLPRHMVLEYVRQAYDFPAWLLIRPQDRQVYVAATQFQTQSGVSFRVREFDLTQDRLSFDIVLPGS